MLALFPAHAPRSRCSVSGRVGPCRAGPGGPALTRSEPRSALRRGGARDNSATLRPRVGAAPRYLRPPRPAAAARPLRAQTERRRRARSRAAPAALSPQGTESRAREPPPDNAAIVPPRAGEMPRRRRWGRTGAGRPAPAPSGRARSPPRDRAGMRAPSPPAPPFPRWRGSAPRLGAPRMGTRGVLGSVSVPRAPRGFVCGQREKYFR